MRTTALQTDAQGHLSGRSPVLSLESEHKGLLHGLQPLQSHRALSSEGLYEWFNALLSLLKYEQGALHYHFALGSRIMWLVLGAGPSHVLGQLGILGEVTFSL